MMSPSLTQNMTSTRMALFPTNFKLQSSHEDDYHYHTPHPLSPSIQPCTTSEDFHELCDQETNNGEDELWDDGLGEKKKRLKMEQVKILERNFESGSKLDPDRKIQLARELGLQPRQIAIWFQNRRARWKTKQLEKDYDVLKNQFEAIKAKNHSLLSQNRNLQSQIMALKNKDPIESINLNVKETEGSCSNRSSENSSEINKLDMSRTLANDSLTLSHHHHQPIPNLLQSSIVDRSHQIYHSSSSRSADRRQHHYHVHGQISDQLVAIKEEGLGNMFVGVEEPSGFWPWLEQQP